MEVITTVVNLSGNRTHPEFAPEKTGRDFQYIGRGSKWGNPFRIGKDGDRKIVVQKYKPYIMNNKKLMESLGELRGKTLGCFCRPAMCHGVILLDLICEKFGDVPVDNFLIVGEKQDVS